ncbi:uncharacterized protein EDB91DRAFT_1118720 [Suillus paluster]|uniref:uncharacterized protein n=1 Tax=Suillus paluster TaxID=48578 RepID=UPI001B862280|nr:uncharacterized protein EDB91DRAFT_1118720 [Suillus paluster]KAG1746758.1 hypothetical protein EDB91DRAFT_1118720 [Suillus paluster]
MAPTNKGRTAGISASSCFDLKVELAKKEDEFTRSKAAGGSRYTKPTVWTRSNKGVHNRAARDIELEEVGEVTIESVRAILERKAKVYQKLRKGKSGGLTEKQYDGLLVDSESDDVDESLTVPQRLQDDDDPMIEYEDEFGRQLYEPSAERIQVLEEAFLQADNPLASHYDSSKEVRAKDAGYYQFSADDETRKQQIEELRSARTRAGAVDLKPEEVEGMRNDSTTAGSSRSREMEKRKRDLEERRKVLDANRRKVKDEDTPAGRTLDPVAQQTPEAVTLEAQDTSGPSAALERQVTDASDRPKKKDKQKGTKDSGLKTEVDDFLAQLERETLGR